MGGKHRRAGCVVVEQKQQHSVERDVSANASKTKKQKTKFNFILKTENHWSVLSEWHVYICINRMSVNCIAGVLEREGFQWER